MEWVLWVWLLFLNDKESANNIINQRQISFFYRHILPYLLLPIGIVQYIIKAIKWRRDINMFPLALKGNQQSNNKTFIQSKQYSFDSLKKWYSNFNKMKLNDLLVASISAALSNYFNDLGINKLTYFTTSNPINMKFQPTKLEDVVLSNEWAPWLMTIPLSNDISYVMKHNRI